MDWVVEGANLIAKMTWRCQLVAETKKTLSAIDQSLDQTAALGSEMSSG